MQQKVVILGSTGSIGSSTLSILSGKNFKVELLTTNKNVNKILKQAILHKVKNVIIEDKFKYLKYYILFFYYNDNHSQTKIISSIRFFSKRQKCWKQE